MPKFDKDDKYPSTDGRSFCVGLLNDGNVEPYWSLKYHPFMHLLLAIKSNNLIQVWDCYELTDFALEYD